MIEQTRFLSTVFLCNELKLVNIYSGANVCGRNVCGIFLGGGDYCVFADRWKKCKN